jgi:hypothetical protein
MPPVTRRGYKNEFKHEVKSDPNPLEGHRPWCPHFPRGRDDLRVVRLNASTLISSAPPRLCASQGTLWYFNPTREGRPPRRPPQCQHPNQLSTTAPLREPRHFMVFQSVAGGTTSVSSESSALSGFSSSRSIGSSIDRLKSGLLSPDLRSPNPHHSLCSFFLEQSCWMRHTHCLSAKAFS